jgi:hypothetical protein
VLVATLLSGGRWRCAVLPGMLGVAPTAVSLIVSDLSRNGVLERREDDADRRRRIIDISPESRPAIAPWLSPGARAWRQALAPLSPAQQRIFVDTLLRYEAAVFSTLTPTAPERDEPGGAQPAGILHPGTKGQNKLAAATYPGQFTWSEQGGDVTDASRRIPTALRMSPQ